MSDQRALHDYSESIRNLKKQCREAGMTDEEFKNMYFQSLNSLEPKTPSSDNPRYNYITKYKAVLIGIIISMYVLYNFKTVYSTIMCNVQEYIYPGLKLLRRLSIPIISLFPSLTHLYHETCLIQNPFFTVVDMDCWPCSSINNVLQIDNPKPVNNQHSPPFIYKTDQDEINMEVLKKMYMNNRDTFNKEYTKIFTNNKYYENPDELFDEFPTSKNLYVWKLHNIKATKLLRQLIPRPKVVPKFGQSTERFIIVDNSQEMFHVPDTECNFSFLLALSGSRDIHLIPAEECKHQCKALKIELKETYLLWYNWWYWRPAVQYSTGNQTFIAHLGSYC